MEATLHHFQERLERLTKLAERMNKNIRKTIYGEDKVPYKASIFGRLLSLLVNHFRGLLGLIILIGINCMTGSKVNPKFTVYCLWATMFLFFLIQPVNIPVTGMIPVFYLPMLGLLDSNTVCKCYFGAGQALFILGGMIGMLMNISKFDRRFMFIMMNPNKPVTPNLLILKASVAAYVMSALSNKLLVSSYMMEVLAPAFSSKNGAVAIQYKHILMNAIQTSATLGGMTFIHGSLNILTMITIYDELSGGGSINYFRYLAVIPLTLTMFALNYAYHVVLVMMRVKNLNPLTSTLIKNVLSKAQGELPKKITAHEIQTIVFYVLALLVFITRATPFGGWGALFNHAPDDPVVGALFVIILSMLPKGCSFIKLLFAKKQSQMPPCKPESGIMFWKFVDNHMNYGYLFLIGGGNVLAVIVNRMISAEIAAGILGKIFAGSGYHVSVFFIVTVLVLLVNVMSGVAAFCSFFPLLASSYSGAEIYKLFAPATLTAGLASSLGFACPFKFTCAYFVHKVAKVPKKSMFFLGFGSAIVCAIPLLIFMMFCGPLIFPKVISEGIPEVIPKPGETPVVPGVPGVPGVPAVPAVPIVPVVPPPA